MTNAQVECPDENMSQDIFDSPPVQIAPPPEKKKEVPQISSKNKKRNFCEISSEEDENGSPTSHLDRISDKALRTTNYQEYKRRRVEAAKKKSE